MHSLFVGVGGVGAIYDASIKGKVYKGIAYGGGITFGYVMNVTKRLFIDFHAGVAAVGYNRKEYFAGDNYTACHLHRYGCRSAAGGRRCA